MIRSVVILLCVLYALSACKAPGSDPTANRRELPRQTGSHLPHYYEADTTAQERPRERKKAKERKPKPEREKSKPSQREPNQPAETQAPDRFR